MRPDIFLDWLAGADLPGPRAAVIVAHPDDEVVGLGSQLRRLREARFVHVTDGAPRDGRDAAAHGLDVAGYGRARRAEAERALALVGVAPDRITGLGIPDQQAALHLAALACRVEALVREHALEVVLTHAYEGGHPDHDATAFAVHAARRRVDFAVVELAGYHRGPDGVRRSAWLDDSGGVTFPTDRELRRRLFACHETQAATLAPFVGLERERLRPAPALDFTRPPHPGPLLYEDFDWGMTGERFRELVRAAEATLAGPCR